MDFSVALAAATKNATRKRARAWEAYERFICAMLRSPYGRKPLIHYEVALLMEPMTMLGARTPFKICAIGHASIGCVVHFSRLVSIWPRLSSLWRGMSASTFEGVSRATLAARLRFRRARGDHPEQDLPRMADHRAARCTVRRSKIPAFLCMQVVRSHSSACHWLQASPKHLHIVIYSHTSATI
eukprot:6180124-Pleurochrysis_carterae.AAC.1